MNTAFDIVMNSRQAGISNSRLEPHCPERNRLRTTIRRFRLGTIAQWILASTLLVSSGCSSMEITRNGKQITLGELFSDCDRRKCDSEYSKMVSIRDFHTEQTLFLDGPKFVDYMNRCECRSKSTFSSQKEQDFLKAFEAAQVSYPKKLRGEVEKGFANYKAFDPKSWEANLDEGKLKTERQRFSTLVNQIEAFGRSGGSVNLWVSDGAACRNYVNTKYRDAADNTGPGNGGCQFIDVTLKQIDEELTKGPAILAEQKRVAELLEEQKAAKEKSEYERLAQLARQHNKEREEAENTKECKAAKLTGGYCRHAREIAHIKGQIANERKIASVSGFVDKSRMYSLGTWQVSIEGDMQRQQKEFSQVTGRKLASSACKDDSVIRKALADKCKLDAEETNEVYPRKCSEDGDSGTCDNVN